MNKQQSGYIKTWRLLEPGSLSNEDIEYIANCNLKIRQEQPARQIIDAGGKQYAYTGYKGVTDIITFDEEQEALFQLRFAGRFSLLNIVQVNTAWFNV